ncbi:blr7222 [Bradyrhizobium diazoefficiens USDA 110]|uniref:Blr7222 protein n=2 Tax=Bradyrhizobium diazoefficiens TaxID=1355477 RepID=Q89E65_BRADU|nr:hypothetical protein CO678_20135 [Bradyrhizobium diazoefficiens]QBP25965.1 AbrB/MazE/SpoVT family DNA-binding domain-containing protein [Bradyrhizobium diazoefficiens]BAC52487.1 blr7222 [Bradyrhizobium diazoefficiens USDA 110]
MHRSRHESDTRYAFSEDRLTCRAKHQLDGIICDDRSPLRPWPTNEPGISYLRLTGDVPMAADKLTTTVSSKGQVVLPKAIREEHRWRAGTRLTIESTPDGVLLKPSSPFPAAKPADVFASLPYRGKPKSVEEMEAGIAAEARRRHARD